MSTVRHLFAEFSRWFRPYWRRHAAADVPASEAPGMLLLEWLWTRAAQRPSGRHTWPAWPSRTAAAAPTVPRMALPVNALTILVIDNARRRRRWTWSKGVRYDRRNLIGAAAPPHAWHLQRTVGHRCWNGGSPQSSALRYAKRGQAEWCMKISRCCTRQLPKTKCR